MAALKTREGMAAKAVEFAVLTACRSGEVRGALWSEFDFAARIWTIPAERMEKQDAATQLRGEGNKQHRQATCRCGQDCLCQKM
jgi:integrase